jgi:ketosteroid isomerase-like protein
MTKALLFSFLSVLCLLPLHVIAVDSGGELRLKMTEYQDAWNRGDVDGVIRLYHPSVDVFVRAERWDYAKEVAYLKQLKRESPDARLRIEVSFVRPLGERYALVSGNFHLALADSPEQTGPFTAVWMRSAVGWQCIYSES